MLIATGITALSRKIKDDRERKKEARQGVLSVGPSDVAMRAFEGQTQRMIQAAPASNNVSRAPTTIKYEDPSDIGEQSPDGANTSLDPEKPDVQDTRRTSQQAMSSPVQSEVASPAITSPGLLSPMDQTITTTTPNRTSFGDGTARPPTYRSRAKSSTSARSPSSYTRDETLRPTTTWDTQSISTRSTNSVGTHAVRVKTKGSNLSSGFDYHPALFDLKVHPDKWAAFTEQVVLSTKTSASDNRKAWAAATATAFTGAIVTSVALKKSMDRSYQEKAVKSGISDMSEGGLGSMLQSWNDQYFTQQGLFVHLELSESAMKNDEQKSKTFRKPALLYSKREDRERKEDERKYVIVVTKLDDDGAPTEAIRAMEKNELTSGNAAAMKEQPETIAEGTPENIAEMPGDTHQGFLIAELPGDDGLGMAELPGGVSLGFSSEKSMQPPVGYVELEPDQMTNQVAEQKTATEMEDTSHLADEYDKLKTNDISERTAFAKETA